MNEYKNSEEKLLDRMVWDGMDKLNETRIKYGQKPYTKEEYLKANPMASLMHGATKRVINHKEDE